MTAVCPRCRAENPPSHRFCVACGQALQASCPRCGFAHEPGARFCGGCGQPILASGPARLASPETYTPPHLAEKIRTSRGTLEGERKQVTVLFADMKGSLELLADRDPEDARRMLDPVLGMMTEAVHRYEGTVNQVLGDGVMAIFGAPVAHENHAVRAAYAALRMHEQVRRLARDLRRAEGVDVQIRVGLNSGEVVVRAIDNDLHMDYSAVGQTTYLAAQMERLARPGSTLLAPETRRLTDGSLLHETRRALHARIVDAIERLYAGRLGEHVERLAHHALRGGLRERAVDYLRQAGAKAAARSAHREAVAFFEQALEILAADGPRGPALATAIDLVFDLRASLAPLGEFTRTLDHLRRAAVQAEALGDRRRLGWVSAYLTQSHYTLGEQAAVIRAAERALEAGRAQRDHALQIVAAFGLGQAHHVLGDYRAAQGHLGRAVAAVDGELSRERWGMAGLVSVASRIWLAASLADTGDFAEAPARAREGVALAETPEHPWSLAGAYMTLGFVHLSQGHLDEAGSGLDRGIVFSREMDLTAWLPRLLCARDALRLAWLAEGYLLAGRVDVAADTADQARRLAAEHAEQGYAAMAVRMRGETAARAGQGPRAAEHYADALARARALEMRPLEALCHLGLGELARRVGDGAAAKARLTEAVGLLREMDMRYWLLQAESALRDV